jgi:peptidyl-prolyl cis-trans isomerase C
VSGFEAACKRLSPGSLSDVVSTSFGYHLIKLTGRKD